LRFARSSAKRKSPSVSISTDSQSYRS
jgi:hypothetical protein